MGFMVCYFNVSALFCKYTSRLLNLFNILDDLK